MATIKDIADYLGIASSTVSKGLNNATDISDKTKEMVIAAAIELGYTPKKRKHIAGQSNQYERKVCIFIENMDYENRDQFGYDLIQGFKQSAELRNWQVDIIPSNLNAQVQNEYDKFMITHRYSGAFIAGFSMHNDYNMQFNKTVIPTVLFDNFIYNNPKVGYVGTDCNEALKQAVYYLHSLGHTKIAFLNGSKNSMVSEERTQAFLEAMKGRNLYIDSHLIETGYYVPDCAKYHVPKFLDYGATAIICASDIIASGAISEVQKRGLKVPDDISIIGYDDLPLCLNITPQLTTIRQDRLNLGKSAMILLDCLINNIPISKSILRPELVIRNSTSVVKKH
jgi:LacI family transcriptional regulator